MVKIFLLLAATAIFEFIKYTNGFNFDYIEVIQLIVYVLIVIFTDLPPQ